MAHIILKTSKQKSAQRIAQPAALNLGIQQTGIRPTNIHPIVMDFSNGRTGFLSQKTLLISFTALISFFITSLVALFIISAQLNHLWREAQNPQTEPEAAFPATTLTPLSSKAFIMGKDFQQHKTAKRVDVVPMLERLPLYDAPKKTSNRTSVIKVETAPAISKSVTLQKQADDALANGNTDKAIQLYLRALTINPDDATLRNNCVALLLEQARVYDERSDTENALSTYKKAETLWRGDAETLRSIHARIAYLESR